MNRSFKLKNHVIKNNDVQQVELQNRENTQQLNNQENESLESREPLFFIESIENNITERGVCLLNHVKIVSHKEQCLTDLNVTKKTKELYNRSRSLDNSQLVRRFENHKWNRKNFGRKIKGNDGKMAFSHNSESNRDKSFLRPINEILTKKFLLDSCQSESDQNIDAEASKTRLDITREVSERKIDKMTDVVFDGSRPKSVKMLTSSSSVFIEDFKSFPSDTVKQKADFLEKTRHVTVTGNLGACTPKQLAHSLFENKSVSSDQISRILTRQDPYHLECCKEFMSFFDLKNISIAQALRKLMEKMPFIGETHAIERMLTSFTTQYVLVNPITFSEESCHVLLCSLLILNSDQHGKSKMKKMSFNDFCNNLSGLCDGNDFPKNLLKSLYNDVKARPLPSHTEKQKKKITKGLKLVKNNQTPTETPNESEEQFEYPVLKTSSLYRKKIKMISGGTFRRTWKLSFVSLKGMQLIFHKKKDILDNPELVLSLNHAKSSIYTIHLTRKNVFYLHLADDRVFLLQEADSLAARDWITFINLTAAILSTPTLPISLANPPFLLRQTYPTQIYKGSIVDLYKNYEKRTQELKNLYDLNIKYEPCSGQEKTCNESREFIKSEIDRYCRYKFALLFATPEMLCNFVNEEKLKSFCDFASLERSKLTLEKVS